MGHQSAEAQGLRQILTNYAKMQVADTRLYIASQRSSDRGVAVVGILKMGYKNLFVRTHNAQFRELQPLCCLDFYVHYSCQRCGLGKKLFEAMLNAEQIPPHRIAYDRPSPKLIGFLDKHYGLRSFTPQENNYVVFHKFFEDEPNSPKQTSRRRRNDPGSMPRPAVPLLQASGSSSSGCIAQGRRQVGASSDEKGQSRHRAEAYKQHASYQCDASSAPAIGLQQPVRYRRSVGRRAVNPSLTELEPSESTSHHSKDAHKPESIDQNTLSPARGHGVRGIQRLGSHHEAARARIPAIPKVEHTQELASYRTASSGCSSRRSMQPGRTNGNFLHHTTADDSSQKISKEQYQASFQQRKASWWG